MLPRARSLPPPELPPGRDGIKLFRGPLRCDELNGNEFGRQCRLLPGVFIGQGHQPPRARNQHFIGNVHGGDGAGHHFFVPRVATILAHKQMLFAADDEPIIIGVRPGCQQGRIEFLRAEKQFESIAGIKRSIKATAVFLSGQGINLTAASCGQCPQQKLAATVAGQAAPDGNPAQTFIHAAKQACSRPAVKRGQPLFAAKRGIDQRTGLLSHIIPHRR